MAARRCNGQRSSADRDGKRFVEEIPSCEREITGSMGNTCLQNLFVKSAMGNPIFRGLLLKDLQRDKPLSAFQRYDMLELLA